MSDNLTGRFRVVAWSLLSVVTVVALLGWLIGKDPGQLGPVIAWVTAAAASGEAANIGKRFTWNADAAGQSSPGSPR